MGDLTVNDIADALKLITIIVAGLGSISGIIAYILKLYLKPIKDSLDKQKEDIQEVKNDIQSVKNDLQVVRNDVAILTSRHNELEQKASNNRELDVLLVKTLRVMLSDSNNEQHSLKTELDNYLINEAVN
jgi:hypothetical protein